MLVLGDILLGCLENPVSLPCRPGTFWPLPEIDSFPTMSARVATQYCHLCLLRHFPQHSFVYLIHSIKECSFNKFRLNDCLKASTPGLTHKTAPSPTSQMCFHLELKGREMGGLISHDLNLNSLLNSGLFFLQRFCNHLIPQLSSLSSCQPSCGVASWHRTLADFGCYPIPSYSRR